MISKAYPAKSNWASNLIPKANEKYDLPLQVSEIWTPNTIGIILRIGSKPGEIGPKSSCLSE